MGVCNSCSKYTSPTLFYPYGNASKISFLFIATIRFTTKTFPDGYSVTVIEPSTTQITVDGRTTELELWDTAGQEAYDRLRPLSYRNTGRRKNTY